MKIEKVKNEIIRNFNDLTVGDAFYPSNHFSSDLYIKTYDFECEEACNIAEDDDDGYNAIKLSNGEPYWFANYDKVVIPNCKIMVE